MRHGRPEDATNTMSQTARQAGDAMRPVRRVMEETR
jgi:hypothetical protein